MVPWFCWVLLLYSLCIFSYSAHSFSWRKKENILALSTSISLFLYKLGILKKSMLIVCFFLNMFLLKIKNIFYVYSLTVSRLCIFLR